MAEAWDRVQRILYEERMRPTVEYYDRIYALQKENKPWNEELHDILTRWNKLYTNPRLVLSKDREFRPRHVHEFPGEYVFRSENFTLLSIIYADLSTEDRSQLIYILMQLIPSRNAFSKSHHREPFPSFRGNVSELPLIAEFVIRHGHAKELFDTLSSLAAPTIPLAILFLQLEEIVALNFTLFSDGDLKEMPRKLQPLREHFGKMVKAGTSDATRNYVPNRAQKEQGLIARQIVESIGGLIEECRRARHLYQRDELLNKNPNLEIESDKKKLFDSLENLGFDRALIQSLRKAEELYKPASDGFDLKSCIGHLRSFLETMHRESAIAVASKANEAPGNKWGEWILFLRNKGIFTLQHEQFVAALYTLMSDKSVHPLTADREYARLLRNFVIEYGVMFLETLSRSGVKIS